MTPEEIDQWLESANHDRPWLAAKLGISMGTLYNGFSKGFSPRSIKAIRALMVESESSSDALEVTFTAREFERIEEARKLLGIATRKLYYEEAIAEYTDQILDREAADKTTTAQNISHFPAPMPSSLVAEEPTSYASSSGGKEKKKHHTDKTGTED